MLRIAICDDEKSFASFLHKSVCDITSAILLNTDIRSFTSADMLLLEHKKERFDIVFLDIDMPDISGFEAAEKIRNTSIDTFIIFITAKRELVYESFEYSPFYFICKSSREILFSEIEHVIKKLASVFKQNKLITLTDSVLGKDSVAIKDIIYIQSDKHYLLYYLSGEAIPRKERNMLSVRQRELEGYDFISTHKRYLINMRHIKRFDTMVNTIIVSNGHEIPISRTSKNATLEKYRIFKRR